MNPLVSTGIAAAKLPEVSVWYSRNRRNLKDM